AVLKPDKYLIFTRRGINIDEYPAIKEHLKVFKTSLMPGGEGGRKAGSYQWYEIQDTVAYFAEFEKPKIIIPSIVKSASYAFDTEGFYGNDKTTIIPLDDKYLLALLNSTTIDYFLKTIAATKQGGFFEYKPVYISQLPIKEISEETKEPFKKLVAEILAKKQNGEETGELEHRIDEMVYRLYELTEAEIAVVEKS
ncbi:MAG TPA: TaqI-like C-terminal specificity domain-containing protein, partial [Patescibacteria group bacterium]|nr:TaqI-like C-terminal specificity domain-containing protein [Patescibacteria group bacterium]